jgi:hypothetical protein
MCASRTTREAIDSMLRAYYAAPIAEFIRKHSDAILGAMARRHDFALDHLQRGAWLEAIAILKTELSALQSGHLLLEYAIPRMGRRVDAVVLLNGVICVIEFKVGEDSFSAHALEQVMDYALDLKNFHSDSHHRPIVPIVVATHARATDVVLSVFEDQVYEPVKVNAHGLGGVLHLIAQAISAPDVVASAWEQAVYKPTPTIIEAAQALYRGHEVAEISRSDAGVVNLSITTDAIFSIIDAAKAGPHKAICFVTGVPGAGKTLAGLNIATKRQRTQADEHAVYLSGNGPLVTVLREALARDKRRIHGTRLGTAQSEVKSFIQNIHHFRDDALASERPPIERVVIFDEAQRAWTQEVTQAFMRRKRNLPQFSMSEPRFLISVMDRHADWCVIVCLVGGGQEINTGEAGLSEWLSAIRSHYRHWRVYISPSLTDEEYTGGQDISASLAGSVLHEDRRLHLAVCLRSFRAEHVSDLVKALLDNDLPSAADLYRKVCDRYPIALTRDLAKAREWLTHKARGSERFGLLTSSGARRLRPHGINVQAKIDIVPWFLNPRDDVRSSFYLEDAATEFDVQGLELDWSLVAWDADLYHREGKWNYRDFKGTRWQNINDAARRRY